MRAHNGQCCILDLEVGPREPPSVEGLKSSGDYWLVHGEVRRFRHKLGYATSSKRYIIGLLVNGVARGNNVRCQGRRIFVGWSVKRLDSRMIGAASRDRP